MLKLKKILICLLAAALAAGSFAGCSQQTANTSTGDSGNDSGNSEEKVELTWYMPVAAQADHDAVMEEVNKYLEEKMNCTLNIIEIDGGNFDTKMQTTIAGQTPFDLTFTAHWLNNFYTNVNKKAYLELDDLLKEHAPNLMKDMPENGWESAKVDGKIMAVPNQQIWAMTNVIYIVKDYVDEYKLDVSTVNDLSDLTSFFEAVKADHPEIYPMYADKGGILDFQTFVMGYDELAGRHIPGVVMLDDENLEVINQFELPQVQEHYKLMYEWNQKGIIRKDIATLDNDKAGLKAGKYIARFDGTMKPGGQATIEADFGGKEAVQIQLSDSWLPTSGITATMTAVSRTSKNPEKAVEFLDLVNSDVYLYNLITQGIEGKHYNKIEGKENYIAPIENSGYTPNMDWAYGNQYLAYLKEGQDEDTWEQTQEINNTAKASPALGFAFDSTKVQTEMASVSAVKAEYELALDSGSMDPDKYMPEFLEKLENAGAQKIIDEVQRQVDEWKKSK